MGALSPGAPVSLLAALDLKIERFLGRATDDDDEPPLKVDAGGKDSDDVKLEVK